jgi:hypothetical protein
MVQGRLTLPRNLIEPFEESGEQSGCLSEAGLRNTGHFLFISVGFDALQPTHAISNQ